MNFNLNVAKALLGAAVVAGAVTAISQPASAISFNTTLGSTSTYSGVTTVGFDNPGPGVVVPSGSSVSVLGGYSENGITFKNDANPTTAHIANGFSNNQFASPPGGTANYLTVGSFGSENVTVDLGGLKGYFGLLIGSLDTFNSIAFFRTGEVNPIKSYGGADLPPTAPNGDQTVGKYYNFFGDNNSDLFDRVVLGSTKAAFEVDNIATRAAIPTPALLPGLIGMGVAAWRKRKGEAAQSEA